MLSGFPLVRNYFFLRDKISEHSRLLDSVLKGQEDLLSKLKDTQNTLCAVVSKGDDFKREMELKISSLESDLVSLQLSLKHQVASEIHSEDHIFNFIKVHDRFRGDIGSALDYYFSTGHESVEKLIALKNEFGLGGRQTLLEFASGYGCVTRHLRKYPSEFEVTACDIHSDAVNFIKDKLKVPCLGSVNQPEDFLLEKSFGMVFALSFFSHMPRRTWSRWLAALYRAVEPGGCLIFTTHGLISQRKMIPHAVIDSTGFWFNENSEQSDLDTVEYGSTITTPVFVRQELAKLEGATEVAFHEGHWWTHQDAWVIKKNEATKL